MTSPAERAMAAVGGYDSAVARTTTLLSFQSEFSHLTSDNQILARNLIERAFLHLQRSIVADPTVQSSWQRAFDAGETACERLGSTHLLLHGIWAFKANSAGERTDLVLGTRLEITPQIEGASEALVLTEWKVVRKASEYHQRADEALRQARLYSAGSLAGFELSDRRYIVIVSQDRLGEAPSDHVENGVEYQFKNIVVAPESPSIAVTRS